MLSSPVIPLSAVQKALRILAELSDPGAHRLSNIVAKTGLNKATTLRLLDTLIEEGFVRRDPEDKSYSLGNEALVMRSAVSRRLAFPDSARGSLIRLAEASGDAANLCIPCGADSVCIDREEGVYPIRANFVHVGRRLPLGVGSAGLALLAWLPEDESDRLLERNRQALSRFSRLTVDRIRRDARAAHDRGYALSWNIVCEGTGGIAVPILDDTGRPIATIGTTALVDRLLPRQDTLAAQLRDEAAVIEATLKQATLKRRDKHQPRTVAAPSESVHVGT